MATRTVVCPVCDAEVPYGRLSCAACGTLLASVAGAARRHSAPAVDGSNGARNVPVVGARPATTGNGETAWSSDASASAPTTPSVLRDWTGPLPASSVAPPEAPSTPAAAPARRGTGILRRGKGKAAAVVPDAADPVVAPIASAAAAPPSSAPPSPAVEPTTSVADEGPTFVSPPVADPSSPPRAPEWSVTPPEPDWTDRAPEPDWADAPPEPAWPAAPHVPTWRATRPTEPAPSGPATPTAALIPSATPGPAVPPAQTLAGAYVAPSIVPSAATMVNGRPATATAIAAASIAEGTVASVAPTVRPNRWFSVPGPAAVPGPATTTQPSNDASLTPGRAGLFSDLPFRAPDGVAGWAVAIGSLVAAISFVLPWAANGVIGGDYGTSWFSRWGLANPASLVPMAASLALLLLALIPNQLPQVVRGGTLPLLIGGLLLGIAWVYVTSAFGLGWGVDALAIGALLLIVGGVLEQGRARTADAGRRNEDRDRA